MKILYWTVAIVGFVMSLVTAKTILETDILVLLGLSFIAFLGYFTQEKLNKWLKNNFSRIYNIFNVKEVAQPEWIKKFQKLTIGIAVICFWASIGGIDLTTQFISGSFLDVNLKENIRLSELIVFILYTGVIPQFFWAFNCGIKKSLKSRAHK